MDSRTAKNYIVALADKNRDALGFLPCSVMHAMYDAGRFYLPEYNDDPCGFLLRSKMQTRVKIWMTAIQSDARRCTLGSQTLAAAIKEATLAGAYKLSLHCREDLEANHFWQYHGFQQVGERVRNKRTRARQIMWELTLPAGIDHYRKLDADGYEPVRERLYSRPRKSGRLRTSTTFPSSNRYITKSQTSTETPVGSTPMTSPSWVPRTCNTRTP